jgi:hypothetical protein
MSDIKVTVGGSIEEDAARRFVDAWHRAERGESFRERHLAFESWDVLARVRPGNAWSCCAMSAGTKSPASAP